MMLGLVVLALGIPQAAPSPAQLIQEARQAWAAEGGKLWGLSLAGPLLIVDPESRQAWASEPDAEGQLKSEGGVFTGTLGAEVSVANTSLRWAGKDWSMVVLPLPEDARLRRVLLLHESFHRVQPALRLGASEAISGHLDQLEGRIWLQLEWRALLKALESSGAARRGWVSAALACRTHRQQLFPQAAEAERNQELAEGLAEYTGVRAASARQVVLDKLRAAQGPYARSFAYTSGPAWGLLLDDQAPGWTRRVRSATDLSVLLQESYRLPAASEADSEAAAAKLGGAEVRAREVGQEEARRARLAAALEPLLHGPTLRVPRGFKLAFNPSNTEAVEGVGAYHPTATYRGEWGVLQVTEGSLRAEDWSEARVAAPPDATARPLKGPGWTLELAPGWDVVPAEPKGTWRIAPVQDRRNRP